MCAGDQGAAGGFAAPAPSPVPPAGADRRSAWRASDRSDWTADDWRHGWKALRSPEEQAALEAWDRGDVGPWNAYVALEHQIDELCPW